jgi:MFS family permease
MNWRSCSPSSTVGAGSETSRPMSSSHLQSIADLVASSLWQALLQGTIVGLLVRVTVRVVHRAGARVRYAILCSGLVLTALAVVSSLAASSSGRSGLFAIWVTAMWTTGMVALSVRVVGGWCVLRRVCHAPPAVRWQSTVRRLSHCLGIPLTVRCGERSNRDIWPRAFGD